MYIPVCCNSGSDSNYKTDYTNRTNCCHKTFSSSFYTDNCDNLMNKISNRAYKGRLSPCPYMERIHFRHRTPNLNRMCSKSNSFFSIGRNYSFEDFNYENQNQNQNEINNFNNMNNLKYMNNVNSMNRA